MDDDGALTLSTRTSAQEERMGERIEDNMEGQIKGVIRQRWRQDFLMIDSNSDLWLLLGQ